MRTPRVIDPGGSRGRWNRLPYTTPPSQFKASRASPSPISSPRTAASPPPPIAMSICNQDDLSVDDLSLKARFKAGRSLTALFMDQRDSVALDSCFEILASPDAERMLGSGKYFDRVLGSKQLGKWSKDPKNRNALWELKEIIGEKWVYPSTSL
ncbi:hypothetical protein B0H13DRAFT_2325047 [Mycena leptocephala]|nr:hypothetical protein B0H13DRAFT_2325047 [Mycena leptocephala]